MTTVALLGGTALGSFDGLTEVGDHAVDTPYGAPSGVISEFSSGPHRVLYLPRHGVGHRVPPHAVNYRANVCALKKLGADAILSVSAVGSLREEIRPGDVVICDQYLDFTKNRPSTFFSDGAVAHVAFADPVCPELSRAAFIAGTRTGARTHAGGTYVCIEGPQFSTRAESRLYRSYGAHVIGMTALPEAKLAREAELPYVTVALATDYDAWKETGESVTVQEVLSVLRNNGATARQIILSLLSNLPNLEASPANRALDDALIGVARENLPSELSWLARARRPAPSPSGPPRAGSPSGPPAAPSIQPRVESTAPAAQTPSSQAARNTPSSPHRAPPESAPAPSQATMNNSSQSNPVLVIGSMALDDLVLPSGSYPNVVGGAATFASVAAALFTPARIVAVVGEDFPAPVLSELERRGVETAGIVRLPGKTFKWVGKYADDLASRETLDTQLNVFADFRPVLPAEYKQSRFVLLGNIHPSLQLEVLDQLDPGAFVAADTMNFWIQGERATLDRLLRRIDCLIINDEELRLLAGTHNIRRAAQAVLALGPKRLIVKKGEHGALLFAGERISFVPAYPLEVEIDPTGAGDSFAGALLGRLAKVGSSSDQALRAALPYATAVASFCVEGVGLNRLSEITPADIDRRLGELARLVNLEE